MTRTRSVLLAIVALIIAGVCIRLGMWQLERLSERRTENARVRAGLVSEPVAMDAIGNDSSRSRALRVHVRGTYDFGHEVAVVNRSRDGAPGVNILTPLRVPGRDTAIVVNRGWVYSPDGATIDLTQWREPPGADGTAYVSWLHVAAAAQAGSAATSAAAVQGGPRRVMRLERETIARMMPYPIAPYQLILIDDAAAAGAGGAAYDAAAPAPFGTAVSDSMRPIRIPLPALDEGPHKSYAAQWFAFAAISLLGTAAVLRKEWPLRAGHAPL